jgi:hypothetical protein
MSFMAETTARLPMAVGALARVSQKPVRRYNGG